MQSYSELYGVIAMFIIAVLIAIPLGRYMGKVFLGEDTWLDVVLNPVDRFIYRLIGIDENGFNVIHNTAILRIFPGS